MTSETDTKPDNPNDPERESNILTVGGKVIENSTPGELDQERRGTERKRTKP